jgi:putative oxidoreductase
MTSTPFDRRTASPVPAQLSHLRDLLGRFPLPLLDLLLRIGIALVFWKSGMAKLANWDLTVALFANEYQVPLLSPDIAALLALTAEIACPLLLAAGLGARFAAAALLGMTLVIQVFVYPENWSEHLLWAALLLYVLTRGAGLLSADYVISRRLFRPAAR